MLFIIPCAQKCTRWFLLALSRKSFFCLLIGIMLSEAKVFSGETIQLEDGSFFSGQVKDGKPQGNGTLTDKYGSNFTGTFANGVKTGFFTVDYSNHSQFKGLYKDDMKNGMGIYAEPCQYEDDNNQCFVEWFKNEKYGKGLKTLTSQVLENKEIEFDALFQMNPDFGPRSDNFSRNDTLDESLAVLFVGEFKDDLYHGNGIYITFYNGEFFTYKGDWKYGKESGTGIQTGRHLNVSEPVVKYEGEFKNGKRHGEGVWTKSNISCSFTWVHNDDMTVGPVNVRCTEEQGEGMKYEGEFKDGNEYGKGVQIGPHGQKYEGWLVNGTQQGVMTWPDGRKYVGEFNATRREGQGLMTYSDGRKYQGEWLRGERFGEGVMIYPDGRKFSGVWRNEGEYSFLEDQKRLLRNKLRVGWKKEDGCICMGDDYQNYLGVGIMTWADGTNYNGEWRRNKEKEGYKNGKGAMVWADGRKYEGEWFKDQMEGYGVMIWPDGREYKGEWSEGRRHGKGVFIWPNGGSFDGTWKNDEMDGPGAMTLKNGKQCIQNWLNGVNPYKSCL